MDKLFTWVLFILGLLDNSACSVNVTCEPRIDDSSRPKTNFCYIKHFPLSDPNQEAYYFQLNYAEPDDVEIVEFVSNDQVSSAVDYIPAAIFTTFPNLLSFRMSTNLRELKTGDFSSATYLFELQLNRNKLKSIRSEVFSPLTKITQSSLQPQDMTNIADGTVFPLHKLYQLSLRENEISEIDDNSFYGLNRLYKLDLQDNQLTTIRRQTFAGVPALAILGLDNNRIETIEDGALDLSALKLLFLRKNRLKRLTDVVFRNSAKMTILDLSENGLEHIGQSLYGLLMVENISLQSNLIQDIDLVAFAKLPCLQKLILTQSGFTFSTTETEDGNEWHSPLIELALDENNLTESTELRKLRIFPRLQVLKLDGNSYANLYMSGNSTIKDVFSELRELHLRRTKIDCREIAAIAEQHLNVVHDCTI